MIAITDLRIGNYTKTFNRSTKGIKVKKILVITVNHLFEIESGTLEVLPIDLIDALLPRFGFSHSEQAFNKYF
jgi:hypothetical protein